MSAANPRHWWLILAWLHLASATEHSCCFYLATLYALRSPLLCEASHSSASRPRKTNRRSEEPNLPRMVQTRDQELRRATPRVVLVSTAAADARSGNGVQNALRFWEPRPALTKRDGRLSKAPLTHASPYDGFLTSESETAALLFAFSCIRWKTQPVHHKQ